MLNISLDERMYVLLNSSHLHQYYIWCPVAPLSATHSDYYCWEHQLPRQGSVNKFKHINRQIKTSDFEIGHSSDRVIWFLSDHNEQCQHDGNYMSMSAKFESVFRRFLVLKNNLKLRISFMETHSYETGVKKWSSMVNWH